MSSLRGLLVYLLLLQTGFALQPNARPFSMPRSAPEAQGVSSAGIEAFVTAISNEAKQEPHSLMILRHGVIVAEGWWAPYKPNLNHGLYSLSKSFTSTAAGLAVAEGKLSVDDKVISFFPDKLPAEVSENLAAMRVRHLLSMSTGQGRDPTGEMVRSSDWITRFFAEPVVHEPGGQFLYNSGATYMVSAIVQKVTGKTLLTYLNEKLLAPLGAGGATWDVCPAGINTGGWGLSVQTETLARFGQMYLQKGHWAKVPLLTESWVEEATRAHIQQPLPAKPGRPHEANDWVQGYGYQFWRCTHNAFRGDGAYGQFMVVMPEQDAVVVITGESDDLQGTLDLVWKHLLPPMRDGPLPANEEDALRLRNQLASLALPFPSGTATPNPSTALGQTFALATNALGLVSTSITIEDKRGVLRFTDVSGAYEIPFGFGAWMEGRTDLPGTPPSLVYRAARKPSQPVATAAAAAWTDDHTLEIILRYTETPHHDTVRCSFAQDGLDIRFQNSLGQKDPRAVLLGRRP
jgi:CubicO group peptidase (beta-lactamase class C family)/NADH:ubiquinone oxidoreductase subunit